MGFAGYLSGPGLKTEQWFFFFFFLKKKKKKTPPPPGGGGPKGGAAPPLRARAWDAGWPRVLSCRWTLASPLLDYK